MIRFHEICIENPSWRLEWFKMKKISLHGQYRLHIGANMC